VIAQELEEQETAAHFMIVGSRGFSLVSTLSLCSGQWVTEVRQQWPLPVCSDQWVTGVRQQWPLSVCSDQWVTGVRQQ